MDLRDIILGQKQELEFKLKEHYIRRNLEINFIENNLIKVIIGPRRAGKSLFTLHFLYELNQNFGYVNFDDDRIMEYADSDEILHAVNIIYQNPKILFFDEIQNMERWELFVNRLQRQNYYIIITGSNSKLLSKELATHLTGRYYEYAIFPFSFSEFLQQFPSALTSIQFKEKFDLYLETGGYPEILLKQLNVHEYLITMFQAIIFKDIVRRFRIRQPESLEKLANLLISNITTEISTNNLSKTLKLNYRTIENYLGYLEEPFLFFTIPRFSYKVKEQITYNRKVYTYDNGWITAKSFRFRENYGKYYENLVAHTLKKGEINLKHKVFYWKNDQNEEVDFLLMVGTSIQTLIQVALDLSNLKTKNREIRALLKASVDLECDQLWILNETIDESKSENWEGITRTIRYYPLWKWMQNQ